MVIAIWCLAVTIVVLLIVLLGVNDARALNQSQLQAETSLHNRVKKELAEVRGNLVDSKCGYNIHIRTDPAGYFYNVVLGKKSSYSSFNGFEHVVTPIVEYEDIATGICDTKKQAFKESKKAILEHKNKKSEPEFFYKTVLDVKIK